MHKAFDIRKSGKNQASHRQHWTAIFKLRLLFEHGLCATRLWIKCGFYTRVHGKSSKMSSRRDEVRISTLSTKADNDAKTRKRIL